MHVFPTEPSPTTNNLIDRESCIMFIILFNYISPKPIKYPVAITYFTKTYDFLFEVTSADDTEEFTMLAFY